jgi:GWxTD domain-containing protein
MKNIFRYSRQTDSIKILLDRSLVILIIVSFFAPLWAEQNTVRGLPLKYKKWLEAEVVYLISVNERAVFLQLDNDRERSLFVQAFWKQRDPTPGTPANEFKTEHYRRISHANKRFGIGSTKPGWKTDRGRVYIILGEPRYIEDYSSQQQLKDTEIWFYQDMTKYHLNNAFYVVFIRKETADAYSLYSPSGDGPNAFFIQNTMMDPADYYSAYEKLREINSSIAEVSLSLIPGEGGAVSGRSSLASDLLIQKITTLPQQQVDDLYAEKLLRYKGIVEVEYSINYIRSDFLVQTRRDDSGVFFVHYLIEPERLSIKQYENKYYSHFVLNGMVSDNEDKVIYQFEKDYSIDLNDDRIESMDKTPLQINDMFPLTPGEYKFSLILKNTTSKEFSSFEENLIIPEVSAVPHMSELLLCYDAKAMEDGAAVIRPFQFEDMLLFSQPKNMFGSSENVYVSFQICGINKELQKNGRLKIEIIKGEETVQSHVRNLKDYSGSINFLEKISLTNIPADYYVLRVVLHDHSGIELMSKREDFAISAYTGFIRPLVKTTTLPNSNDAVNNYRLGIQFYNQGKYEDAASEFAKAVLKKPDDINFAVNLAGTYLHLSKFDEIPTLLMPFLKTEPEVYEVYFYLGKAAQYRNENDKALEYFIKAASHFGLNIPLLNSMGDCYFQINNFTEASKVWEKSLEMNPEQPLVQKKLESIRRLY